MAVVIFVIIRLLVILALAVTVPMLAKFLIHDLLDGMRLLKVLNPGKRLQA